MATSNYRGLAGLTGNLLLAGALLVASALLGSCDNVGPDRTVSQHSVRTETISVGGTVVFRDKDGGFFGILTDNGGQYELANLDPQYHMDGLRVKITGKLDPNHLGTHNWGNPIEIDRVQAKS